jgi:hypothetical protein
MALFAAAAQGYNQVVFWPKRCTYHISHSDGWESEMPLEKIMYFSMKPMLSWKLAREAATFTLRNKGKYDINKPDWGLLDVELKEVAFN